MQCKQWPKIPVFGYSNQVSTWNLNAVTGVTSKSYAVKAPKSVECFVHVFQYYG